MAFEKERIKIRDEIINLKYKFRSLNCSLHQNQILYTEDDLF